MAIPLKTSPNHHPYLGFRCILPNNQSFGYLWTQIASAKRFGSSRNYEFYILLLLHLEASQWRNLRTSLIISQLNNSLRVHSISNDIQPYNWSDHLALSAWNSRIWCYRSGYDAELASGSNSFLFLSNTGIVSRRPSVYIYHFGYYYDNWLHHKLKNIGLDKR